MSRLPHPKNVNDLERPTARVLQSVRNRWSPGARVRCENASSAAARILVRGRPGDRLLQVPGSVKKHVRQLPAIARRIELILVGAVLVDGER